MKSGVFDVRRDFSAFLRQTAEVILARIISPQEIVEMTCSREFINNL
jgi:hypothetical protein